MSMNDVEQTIQTTTELLAELITDHADQNPSLITLSEPQPDADESEPGLFHLHTRVDFTFDQPVPVEALYSALQELQELDPDVQAAPIGQDDYTPQLELSCGLMFTVRA